VPGAAFLLKSNKKIVFRKKISIFEKEKKSIFLKRCESQGTHGCPQKMSANLNQPFGQL